MIHYIHKCNCNSLLITQNRERLKCDICKTYFEIIGEMRGKEKIIYNFFKN